MLSLTRNQFLTLAALLRCPMHPYAIRSEIIEMTGHRIWPSRSSLRKTIDKLRAAGLIEGTHSNPNYWLKARRSEPYELTGKGRQLLTKEWEMYRQLTAAMLPGINKLGQEPPWL